MQLLVLILKRLDLMDDLIKHLAESGVKGGTILDGFGMAKTLVNMEDLPIFGMLRHLLENEDEVTSKVMMFVLKDEQMMTTRDAIKHIIGDFNIPNTGIIFSIPVTYVEGLGE